MGASINLDPKVRSTRYKIACGRAVGRSHTATVTPCQDYVAARSTQGVGCLALADGAGSRSHSEIGAQEAVKATLRVLNRNFDDLYTLALTDPVKVATRVLEECRRTISKKARLQQLEVDAFACTLMFVAHKDERYLAGHLGDGVIAIETELGIVDILSHPNNGEYANTTFFITEPDAESHFRIYTGVHLAPAFALMSDGTAESLYLRATRRPAGALLKLFQWTRELSKAKAEDMLASNLAQVFGARTTDDCSIGILTSSARDS